MRDHAEEILTAVVRDMETTQSDHQQSEKSKGNAKEGGLSRIGQIHAIDRLESGLNVDQLVAEYRALRSSVLRLWEQKQGESHEELTRFNEAIDEILGKSAARYSETVDATREQFLGILSHDLRNPIGAISMAANLLADSTDAETLEIATLISISSDRMDRMVNDLLDLTRTRLGTGIPVTTKPMELNSVCGHVIAELQAIHPDCRIRFESEGDPAGEWDSDRLSQVVSNLVANAIQYGTPGQPVGVVVGGTTPKCGCKFTTKGRLSLKTR